MRVGEGGWVRWIASVAVVSIVVALGLDLEKSWKREMLCAWRRDMLRAWKRDMLCVEERHVVFIEQRHVVCERDMLCVWRRDMLCACQPATLPTSQSSQGAAANLARWQERVSWIV